MTDEPLRIHGAFGPHKCVELAPPLLHRRSVKGWWYTDVWIGPMPLIKLMLALQVAAVVGAWWR